MAHTPRPWRPGKHGGCVVSDKPPQGVRKETGHADVDYYGGFLICESVFRIEDAWLISAAPDLYRVAKDFEEVLKELGLFCECGRDDCRTTRLRVALSKVTPLLPAPTTRSDS
ncbi:protein of unknown function [Pararobbsia alpina]|uniref:hypothetical protein n=1 Tax=Pararobbsia alpina TaxID=621374 RepID=UPI0039A4E56F